VANLTVVPGKHRRYTKREKAAAVVTAEMSTTMAAAEATGIPRTTIAYWLEEPEFVTLRQKTRGEMAEGFTVLGHLAMARLKELVPTMEPRDLTILLGVVTEKAQLLAGQPTARTETRALTDSLDDHERAALRAVIEGALTEVPV
jgi:hypothetical protein